MATVDAMMESRRIDVHPSTEIDEEVLKRLEVDMDMHEKISSLFLIMEDYKLGYTNFIAYGSDFSTMISNFIRDRKVVDWQSKIFEAICLVQNHEILLNLGFSPEEARLIFPPDISEIAYKVNKYARAFYCLFDHLSSNDTRRLLDTVYRQITQPDRHTWPDGDSLEIHALWWIHEGFVEISQEKWNLKRILKVLKALKLTGSDAYETLTKYDTEDNYPCHYDTQSNSDRSSMNNVTEMQGETDDEYKISNGLAIVFNQMSFPEATGYEYRHGSEKDCELIKETFETTFGFNVEIHNNSNRQEIYDVLDSLHWSVEREHYNCVFVFVLSHGTYGNVIASDGLKCPIEDIRRKMCSDALLAKPKVLVIQACQRQALTTDDPATSCLNVRRFEDFLLLSSTIPGELSVRHSEEGTWYVQTFCRVLIEVSSLRRCVEHCARELNKRFNNKEAEINGEKFGQVPNRVSTMGKKLVLPIKVRRRQREAES